MTIPTGRISRLGAQVREQKQDANEQLALARRLGGVVLPWGQSNGCFEESLCALVAVERLFGGVPLPWWWQSNGCFEESLCALVAVERLF